MGVPGRAESTAPVLPLPMLAPPGPQAESRCCCCCCISCCGCCCCIGCCGCCWYRKPAESGREAAEGAGIGSDREALLPIGLPASWEAGAEPGLVACAVCCACA